MRSRIAVVLATVPLAASMVLASNMPAARALPCPDGSMTCGPTAPTFDPTPGGGANTTAPQAPQTTVPPATDGGLPQAPTQTSPNTGGNIHVQTPDFGTTAPPPDCILNCEPTPTVQPSPTAPTTGVRPTTTPNRPGPTSPRSSTQTVKPHDPPKQSDVTEVGRNKNSIQCLAAESAAADGDPIPGLANFVDLGVARALSDKVVVTVVPVDGAIAEATGFTSGQLNTLIDSAMANWNQAGSTTFVRGTAAAGDSTLRISFDQAGGGVIADTAGQQPSSMVIHLGALKGFLGNDAQMTQIVTHEMGHTLGIGHTCPGSVMDGSGRPGMSLSPLDIALAKQGKAS